MNEGLDIFSLVAETLDKHEKKRQRRSSAAKKLNRLLSNALERSDSREKVVVEKKLIKFYEQMSELSQERLRLEYLIGMLTNIIAEKRAERESIFKQTPTENPTLHHEMLANRYAALLQQVQQLKELRKEQDAKLTRVKHLLSQLNNVISEYENRLSLVSPDNDSPLDTSSE